MEDFLKHTFTQADIDQYVSTNAEESPYLEFKRGDALRTDDEYKLKIGKAVSAFANSDGGVLIYGIEETNHKASNLFFVNGKEISKEWLEQVLNSKVQRKIQGLVIDPIRYDNQIDKTIYVLKIPRSVHAPHMTADKKFYKRGNFQAIAMEEYEVRDLYTRTSKTQLEIVDTEIVLDEITTNFNGKILVIPASLTFLVYNKGTTIEELYKMEIRIPSLAIKNQSQDFYKSYKSRIEEQYTLFSVPNKSPIFQFEKSTIGTVKIYIAKDNYDELVRLPILMKLFYTNGVEEKTLRVLDDLMVTSHLNPSSSKLTFEHF